MPQTSNRFYDQMARLWSDAASVAHGVRREAGSLFRTQAERFIADMDLVKREDFDAVRELAANARAENATLHARIAALEARLAGMAGGTALVPATETLPASPPAATRARKPAAQPAGEAPADAPKPRRPSTRAKSGDTPGETG